MAAEQVLRAAVLKQHTGCSYEVTPSGETGVLPHGNTPTRLVRLVQSAPWRAEVEGVFPGSHPHHAQTK
jgi:hypothetical protein